MGQGDTMKAIVREQYGSPDVLELKDIDKPVAKDDEVLVRVLAAGVNMADVDYMRGRPSVARVVTGLRTPKIRALGVDVAGRVESVGKSVKRLQPGDEVWGDLTEYGYGAFAEYASAREDAFALKPARMTFEEAATVPQAAVMALQGLRGRRRIQPGHHVLVNGGGGGVGTFAVQMAKSLGAEVTGVDSARKLDMMRSIGADHVVDYAQEDFTRGRQRYDWILDVAAYHSVFDCRRALRPKGSYVVVPDSPGRMFQVMFLGPLISMVDSRRMGMLMWKPFETEDIAHVKELIESGNVTPIIDRQYELSEVPEALRYLDAGHARGKLVITVQDAD
jgi:NADPH:quinone reductase-like Zn-dependent oxidoreductase